MTKSQNTKSERNADVSKTLTEQWKKGGLPEEGYYVKGKRAEGIYAYTAEYLNNMYRPRNGEIIIEQVPSYEELQNMNKAVNECMAANIKLVEENKNLSQTLKASEYLYAKSQKEILDLKELLKEVLRHELSLKEISELSRKISEALR